RDEEERVNPFCSKTLPDRKSFFFSERMTILLNGRGAKALSLLDALQERILIGDGAMSTLLFSYGVDCCFEELCLRHPEEIFEIHRSYVKAGGDVIQTNTYRANYIKLSRYGLEEQVKNINSAAVRIAKEAAN